MIDSGSRSGKEVLAYAFRRPDPWPRVFGYHEVFHALVVIAAICHFAAIAAALPALST